MSLHSCGYASTRFAKTGGTRAGSHYVAQGGLKQGSLLPPPENTDCRCATPHPIYTLNLEDKVGTVPGPIRSQRLILRSPGKPPAHLCELPLARHLLPLGLPSCRGRAHWGYVLEL